jgi:hypothetical protein
MGQSKVSMVLPRRGKGDLGRRHRLHERPAMTFIDFITAHPWWTTLWLGMIVAALSECVTLIKRKP